MRNKKKKSLINTATTSTETEKKVWSYNRFVSVEMFVFRSCFTHWAVLASRYGPFHLHGDGVTLALEKHSFPARLQVTVSGVWRETVVLAVEKEYSKGQK